MDWVALINWVFVAGLALGAARTQLVSLAGQAILALAGLAAMTVLVAGGALVWALIAVGVAGVTAVFGTVAPRTLIEDQPDTARRVGQPRMETAAALEGLPLPLLATASLLSLLAAFS